MTHPTALRLADALRGGVPYDEAEIENELRRLHAERTAADGVINDLAEKVRGLQAARERDNVSFKQLLAQRDELLEALELSRAQWIHSVNADLCLAAIAKAQQ